MLRRKHPVSVGVPKINFEQEKKGEERVVEAVRRVVVVQSDGTQLTRGKNNGGECKNR
jgi:hypothetical protein